MDRIADDDDRLALVAPARVLPGPIERDRGKLVSIRRIAPEGAKGKVGIEEGRIELETSAALEVTRQEAQGDAGLRRESSKKLGDPGLGHDRARSQSVRQLLQI